MRAQTLTRVESKQGNGVGFSLRQGSAYHLTVAVLDQVDDRIWFGGLKISNEFDVHQPFT
jgi:hypothetical protein